MKKISYADFITNYQDKAVEENVLTSCMFDITYRCSNKCLHCYCLEHKDVRAKELSTSKIKEILNELKNNGCLWISFSGGEPFLRSDFLEIYLYAKKLGFIVSIMTNATLITEEIAQVLNKHKPVQVNVSMYGSTKEKYEKITQVEGSFAKFLNGINLLKKYDINVQLQAILMTLSLDDIKNIQAFSEENGYGYCKFDPFLFNDIYGEKRAYPYRVNATQIVKYEREDCRRYEQWEKFSCRVLEKGIKQAQTPNDCCSTCGRSKIHIDPYGNLMGCNLLREPCVNLNEYSLIAAREKLVSQISEKFEMPYPHDFECSSCEIRHLCNCCPGVSFIETGSIMYKSAFACEIAHERKKFFTNV